MSFAEALQLLLSGAGDAETARCVLTGLLCLSHGQTKADSHSKISKQHKAPVQ
jgi:hypothetical protein